MLTFENPAADADEVLTTVELPIARRASLLIPLVRLTARSANDQESHMKINSSWRVSLPRVVAAARRPRWT